MAKGLPDYTYAILIKGEDPTGNLINLKTDENGNLIIVAKGSYLGTLTTLATDEEGRVLMIPYDPGGIWGEATAVTLAELACRLDSPKKYDRRGEVLWMESFSYGLQRVDPAGLGAPVTASLTTERARTGGYSAKMSLGPTASNWGAIYHAEPYLAPSRFGFEVSFTCHYDVDYYEFSLVIHFIGDRYEGKVRFYPSKSALYYLTFKGGYNQFATDVNLSDDNRLFHTAKLVVDANSGKYVRFMLDHRVYDLSAYNLYHLTATPQPAVIVWIRCVPEEGKTPVIYIDDLIITQNES